MFLRNPFTKALFDARRSLLGWALAVTAVGSMYAAFWPSVQSPEMQQALAAYPKGVLEAFNYDDLTSAAGYLGSSVYGLLVPLLIVVFSVGAGTRAIAGDEEAGTLDLLLAHPVGRVRLAVQRYAALLVALAVIVTLLCLAMLALRGPAQFDGVTAGELAAITLQLLLFGGFFGALAFAVGAATGRKGLTLGISAGVAVLAYLANGVIPQVDGLAWAREVSPFHWYLGGDPLVNGVQLAGPLLLIATTSALLATGTWALTRRDVAT
ncbi:ABC-2 type transport system permease protein [Micromonospora pattaloongensis]|uniref:ABC-2 type transport system permease protein n=1 Tax=Micromonospora pattaloongensis TaxID=405436 RepID=A0A1H3SS98_9ACTN|nr:ABC transporter permease [Micromonospora pattaloongensis]SDZ40548.1 ABC-2 type transport system permease protein [Micromonospora pattaloongensis]